jgi:hypothetical protein
METIKFSEMTPEARQILIDLIWHERHRHLLDIQQADEDIAFAKENYGINPRDIYLDKWIDVKQ